MAQGISMRTCLDPRTRIELAGVTLAFLPQAERQSQQSPKALPPAGLATTSNKTPVSNKVEGKH